MHLLQLCPRFPFPLTDGGRIGIFHITETLVRHGHTVDMITFANDDTTTAHIAALGQICRVTAVRANTKTNFPNFLRSIMRNEPVYITRHQHLAFHRALHNALDNTRYDAVYGDHTAMFPYLIEARRFKNLPTAARLHNVESVIWHRYALDERGPLKRMIARRQAKMLEKIESRNAERVDVNFMVTDVDREYLQRLAPAARLVTVVPGVDGTKWLPVARSPRSTIAVTATTFSWIHNVNGMHWFLDRVMPLVQREVPDFKLELLGPNPPPSLRKRASANVSIRGFVDDIRPIVAQAGVYIVPLHVGSGIRIKILEAMAMGMPVVTTSVGCEGIAGENGKHFMIADSAEDFADAVIVMLTQPDRADAMGKAAREFVVQHFNWDASVNIIERELASLIERRANQSGEARQ